MISGKSQLLGVIGYPISHSLSPVMHNAALAVLQQTNPVLDFVYLPFAIKPEDLAVAIAGLAALNVRGFNVTIPHKQAILPLLTGVSELAQQVGAVNTVWATEQGWQGTNTDVLGFLAPLHQHQRDWSQVEVALLGCGGAARAVVVGCAQFGCSNLHVFGRDLAKLAQFQAWGETIPGLRLQVHAWQALPAMLPQVTLVVNSTPIGMASSSQVNPADQSPLTTEELTLLPATAIVYDLIYTPNPTQLLNLATRRGLVVIDGLEMLVQQGAAALEIWLQQTPPVDTMRRAARECLGLN